MDQTDLLLDQVRAGDRQALDRLLTDHRPYLRSIVQLRIDPKLQSRVDASDVVQEAQLEAVRRVGDYLAKPALPFRLWLRQIVCDRLIMAHRQHVGADKRAISRESQLPDESSAGLGQLALAGGSSPSQQLARHEMAARVRRALTALPADDQDVLLMRNFEGLSNQETAQVLGIDPAAASKRYGRALLRLRAALLAEGVDEGSQ